MTIANENNYFTNTQAIFKNAVAPNREPDYISSNSSYWYTKEGVYRNSNHWGENISTCSWYHENVEKAEIKITEYITGFAKWEDFEMKDLAVFVVCPDGKELDVKLTFDNVIDGCFVYENHMVYVRARCLTVLDLKKDCYQ